MSVLTIVGARPQFIKAWPLAQALKKNNIQEVLVHTGQHYDDQMSRIFFDELGLTPPAFNLGVGSGTHAEQTAAMLVALERTVRDVNPSCVVVFGDTNTTLAGAIAACKLGVPVAHVEAGLRSFNRAMPEEHNRVLVDHCSNLLFCPTQTAVANLAREGVVQGVHLVGDVMFDAIIHFAPIALERSTLRAALGLAQDEYVLATVHRAYNTDDPAALARLLQALNGVGKPTVFPIHPRTRSRLREFGIDPSGSSNVRFIDPVGYFDMLALEQGASVILTDSGGVQKEAFFLGVPCVTLRPETEWVETVENGWNRVVGSDPVLIAEAAMNATKPKGRKPTPFGDGTSAVKIADILTGYAEL